MVIPSGTYILCTSMKYYPPILGACPDIDILLVARCLVPSARLLYLCHEACDKRSQATGPRKGKGKQRKHTNVGVDIQSYMHHKVPNNVREIADRRFVAWSAVNF